MSAPRVASTSRFPMALSRHIVAGGPGRALPSIASARFAVKPAEPSALGQLRLGSSSASQEIRPVGLAKPTRVFQPFIKPSLLGPSSPSSDAQSARGVVWRSVQPLLASRFSTSPLSSSAPSSSASSKPSSSTSSSSRSEYEREEDMGDEPPPKASFRERMRFLSKRYGWWALLVYMLASLVDFTVIFLAIHLLGAEHIRGLETRFRKWIGMAEREMKDEEVAAWPVPIEGSDKVEDGIRKLGGNNAEEAKKAGAFVKGGEEEVVGKAKSQKERGGAWISSTLWTEIVLAYTIHKTLFLPFRVAVTAAITPSFVKQMVRLGWAKPNNAVKVGKKIKEAAQAAGK